ncbi:MAG: OmpA family protein [Myxococcales bacterium]|nr:OmpA family protein [Myxococcales bacterium]
MAADGPAEKRQPLSQARADAVEKVLAGKGVTDARLVAVGLGDTKPVQPNDTAAGREANQRVEVVLGK